VTISRAELEFKVGGGGEELKRNFFRRGKNLILKGLHRHLKKKKKKLGTS
jgi:hypothetical protein